jgi:hypothetical protein
MDARIHATGSDRDVRAGRQAVLATLVAAMLSAAATRAARCEVRATATPALVTATEALHTATPARVATPAHRAATAGHGVATPALHTATIARPLHHHARHGALAHRATRRHVSAEIRVHPRALRTVAGTAPAAPPAPARESHPRAALPLLVRPAHHPGGSGGARLACALRSEGGTLAVCSTTIRGEGETLVPGAGHEPNEARGPPRRGPIALIPPAFARRPSFLPRAPVLRSELHSNFRARPALERDRRASRVACTPHAPARDPFIGPAPVFVVPALPPGRADVRRMESAAAYPSGLSAGGVS